jgi:hypothetical protein
MNENKSGTDGIRKDRATKSKPSHGPKGAIAWFKRPNGGVIIHVFARNGETDDNAITRVKKHNGAGGVEHHLYL